MNIHPLQFITHTHPKLSPALQILKALEAGIRWVQLRMKNADEFIWEKEAVESKEYCEQFGATLIINDNVDVAYRVMADGIHLGKTDMHPEEARSILGPKAIIGWTCNTKQDILDCCSLPIDYIGLGPYRETTTKEKISTPLGLDGLGVASHAHVPVVGIGGIRLADLSVIRTAPVQGIAFSGLLLQADDWNLVVQELKTYWNE